MRREVEQGKLTFRPADIIYYRNDTLVKQMTGKKNGSEPKVAEITEPMKKDFAEFDEFVKSVNSGYGEDLSDHIKVAIAPQKKRSPN